MNERMNEGLPARMTVQTRSRVFHELAVALLLAVTLTGALALRVTPIAYDQLQDSLNYIAMAERPLDAHTAPYCYRILVPTLARLVPFDLSTSFYLLTFAFISATGILVYYVLRHMQMTRFIAVIGMLLFYGLNWGARFAFFDFRLTDPALFFFAMLSLLLLLQDRHWLVVFVLSIGVLGKESILFILPFVYTLRARKLIDGGALLRAMMVGIVPVLVLVMVRSLVDAEYDVAGLWSAIGKTRIEGGMVAFVRGGTVGTWGVEVLLASMFSGARGRTWLMRSVPFLALVYLQPFFAINVDRLLVLGFVAMVPLAAFG